MKLSQGSIYCLFAGLNALYALGIAVLLMMALLLQFMFHELPCPLCLLQRVGFLLVTLGFLCNLRFGYRPIHYVISLYGILLTAFVALRQISLHIVPGTGSYGPAVFGLHLYTWSFVVAMMVMIATLALLAFDGQYHQKQASWSTSKFAKILVIIVGVIVMINLVSTMAECGFYFCPENPTRY